MAVEFIDMVRACWKAKQTVNSRPVADGIYQIIINKSGRETAGNGRYDKEGAEKKMQELYENLFKALTNE